MVEIRDLRQRQLVGSVPDRTVFQKQDGLPLSEVDPACIEALRECGNRWGPSGVALVAAQMAGGVFARRVPEAQVNRPITAPSPDELRLLRSDHGDPSPSEAPDASACDDVAAGKATSPTAIAVAALMVAVLALALAGAALILWYGTAYEVVGK